MYMRHARLFCIVPVVSVTVDASSTIAVNGDSITSENKAGSMVLKSNRIRIVAPVVEVVGKLHSVSMN